MSVTITLSDEEAGFLVASLRTVRSDLRMEIADTDRPSYKRVLRSDKAILDRILVELGQPVA
ncbi:MAG TPA: hypothetical protein VGQ20_10230 [Acidimicrobiales bacterium]|jgi:hypothetical protein|nr:hypothetical protein [Acidimicrobiales bacterium]